MRPLKASTGKERQVRGEQLLFNKGPSMIAAQPHVRELDFLHVFDTFRV